MRKAGDILLEIFRENFGREFPVKDRPLTLFSSWDKIAAEAFGDQNNGEVPAAGHSRIREFDQGAIIIEADHPGWVQILKTRQAEILSAAKRFYPELDIKRLSFVLGWKSV
jgi:hypothetical protein